MNANDAVRNAAYWSTFHATARVTYHVAYDATYRAVQTRSARLKEKLNGG